MNLYLIGSLRNPEIPGIAQVLRDAGHSVFDDWHAAGPDADDCWKAYEQARGRSYADALQGYAAEHVFDFDLRHLHRADAAVLVMPCGRSGHLELGYMLGTGRKGYVILDSGDRWDVMYRFADGVFASVDELVEAIAEVSC